VRRIFRAYAAGASPKRIALALNQEAVPGPRGGAWGPSSINGHRVRGTGILNNELYIGRLTWNRLTYAKDPETGRRRSRPRDEGERIVTVVPMLRIVDQPLWDAAKERQRTVEHGMRSGELAASGTADVAPLPFWSKQRPRYLFSGLMRCGVCGGGFSKISAAHFGCSTARNKGPTACTNLRTIRRTDLEDRVLGALRERLMDPALFKVFAEAFTSEWNRLQGTQAATRSARADELRLVRERIERLVDAITEGTPAAAVRDRLESLEARRLALEAEAPGHRPRRHRCTQRSLRSTVRRSPTSSRRWKVTTPPRLAICYARLSTASRFIRRGMASASGFAANWRRSLASRPAGRRSRPAVRQMF
jgi:site-specific DNA recombinase